MRSILILLCLAPLLRADDGFALRDQKGEYLDVLLDGRIAVRYMYAHDASTPQQRTATNKPFLHVFDAAGKRPITNGPGGDFPHHRGIFIGWTRIRVGARNLDFWGMGTGNIVHQKFADQKADRDSAAFTSHTLWSDKDSKALLEEARTTALRRGPAGVRLLIDFESKLTAKVDLVLDGDPEHGGVQFRAANDVDRAQMSYFFPREKPNAHTDLDYPWVGQTFVLEGQKHAIVQIDHPRNPRPTRWSAYRDYGRFGAFFKHELKAGETLNVRYRFVIAEGELPEVALIQKAADDFVGAKEASAVPKVTRMPAERSAPPATKPATKPAAK